MTMIDIITPRLPPEIDDLVTRQVDLRWNEALQMPCAEIVRRGHVDGFGEPSMGVIARWEYSGDLSSDPAAPLPISGFNLTIAEDDDDPDITHLMYVFRTDSTGRNRLCATIIAKLHFEHVVRLNPARPAVALEDDELAQLANRFSNDRYILPITPEALKQAAIDDLAFEEQCLRMDGESQHQRLHREAAQASRRSGLNTT